MAVRHLIGALALVAGCAQPPATGALSPEQARASLAGHPWTWHDDAGAEIALTRFRGTPVLLTAIYTDCNKVCPRTVTKLRHVEEAFQKRGQKVEVVLVSLDPENDTPERLRAYKEEHGLGASWHLLQGTPEATRGVVDLLDLHTLRMDAHIFHESRILVFDADGRAKRGFDCCDFAPDAALF